ncbi:MAG: C25 family cysteine peptidase, partial [Cyclobacteriaceae bacterium]
NAGEIFGSTVTFGEDWLLTANLGAVGFVAHADFALSSALKQYSSLFYQYAFADEENFASSIGEIMRLVTAAYFDRYGITQLSQSQLYGMLLQGDPALKVFGADKPDFDINEDFISFEAPEGSNLTGNSASFEMNLNIKNYGKTTKENLEVKVTRTLPDGSIREYTQSINPIKYQDTVRVQITNDTEDQNVGLNSFQIALDPENQISELNEINNISQVEFFLAEGTAIILFPFRDEVISTEDVTFKYQSANFLSTSRDYDLQIDTSAVFNSPYKKDFVNSGDLLLEQSVNMSGLPDSTAVFWRVRYSNFETGEDTSWVNGRFSVIKESSSTWTQVSNKQLVTNQTENIVYDNQQNLWDFRETTRPVEVNTHGTNNGLSYEDYRVVIDGLNLMATDNPNDPFCRLNTINAVVFDNQTGAPIRPFGFTGPDISNRLVCGVLPQMIHNFTEADVLGPNRYLDSLISLVENGTSLLIFSLDSVAFSNWDDQLKTSLTAISIDRSSLNGLVDGQPLVMLGKKGLNAGQANVLISDGTTIPRKQQALRFVNEVVSKFSQGNMTSELIGPALSWERFDFNVTQESADISGFNVLGINNLGQETVLQAVNRIGDSDLSTINADIYPYLKLRWFSSDFQDQTAPQLNGWSVTYQSPPEGILKSANIESESLQEGAIFNRQFQFLNIGEVSFEDSIRVVLKMTNINSGNNLSDTLKYAASNPGDTTFIETNFNTVGQAQENNLLITVDATTSEQYTINNTISFPKILEVIPDQTNPVLDVTFDGNYILAGDIVSPSPLIEIKVKDENEFLVNDDTSGVNISLRLPCEGCEYERVPFASNKVTYSKATNDVAFNVEYRPGSLEDGVYGVRVQAEDKTGNQSGAKPFETTFEVINESSISHFYPYPNPFSTSMRFVFTLTGAALPEAIKVQIMTVSGRVVREISAAEIGLIKIGHNITEFAWDGKDEYGDQLANGVYFYKVFTKNTGEPFKHFDTTADRAFKNGFGKIYLLR